MQANKRTQIILNGLFLLKCPKIGYQWRYFIKTRAIQLKTG
jgi:hypothetical protein